MPIDPKIQAIADNCQSLVGRQLIAIEVSSLGVMFHFSNKNNDSGAAYWAYQATPHTMVEYADEGN